MDTTRLKKILEDENTKKLEVLKRKLLVDPEAERLRKQVANLSEALELDYGCTKEEIQEYLEA